MRTPESQQSEARADASAEERKPAEPEDRRGFLARHGKAVLIGSVPVALLLRRGQAGATAG